MPQQKSLQDTTDKGILLALGSQVSIPVHEPAAAHDDLANVMATFKKSPTNRNDSTNNRTPNTKNQNLVCCFGTIENNLGYYSQLLPPTPIIMTIMGHITSSAT